MISLVAVLIGIALWGWLSVSSQNKKVEASELSELRDEHEEMVKEAALRARLSDAAVTFAEGLVKPKSVFHANLCRMKHREATERLQRSGYEGLSNLQTLTEEITQEFPYITGEIKPIEVTLR